MIKAGKERVGWSRSSAVPVGHYFLFCSLALIVIFAWMEPVGAAGLGFWKGLVFWTIQISILMPLLITVQHFATHYFDLKKSLNPWIQTALSGIISAMLFTPIAYLLDVLFAVPEDESPMGLAWELLDEASGVVVPVTVTWLALNAPWIFQLDFSLMQGGGEAQKQVIEKPASSQSESPTRFQQELRSRSLGELISISSELHYVRVVTTDREVMFLFNLKDAIDQLPSDAGVQIHRSHWVAKAHIKELTKKNGSAQCILSNGKRLPVSRRKYSEIKDRLVPPSPLG